jgi:hypothetical protein
LPIHRNYNLFVNLNELSPPVNRWPQISSKEILIACGKAAWSKIAQAEGKCLKSQWIRPWVNPEILKVLQITVTLQANMAKAAISGF